MPKPTKAQLEVLRQLALPYRSGAHPWPKDAFRMSTIEACRRNGWVECFPYRLYLWAGAVRLTDVGRAVLEQYGEV